jgi:hypothetical protein
LANIRKDACKQRPKSALPDYRFSKDRQHWWLVNANDTGFPVKDCWRLQVEKDDPQMIGPEGCWQAKDVPTIYVRAACRATNKTAELFWETADKAGFQSEQSVRFALRSRSMTYRHPR